MEMSTTDQQASETEFDDITWTSVRNPRRGRICRAGPAPPGAHRTGRHTASDGPAAPAAGPSSSPGVGAQAPSRSRPSTARASASAVSSRTPVTAL
jgi:hypothetical protein